MRNQALLLTACAALAAVPASAATRCVTVAGTAPCFAKLQDAVTAASAGDTITIAPGTYYEYVNIPSGKDGLIIAGASKLLVNLDSSPNSVTGFLGGSPNLSINSNDVKVRNLTIRNGTGDGIDVYGNNTLLQYMRFLGNDGVSIYVGSTYTGTQILNNDFRSMYDYGIQTAGTNTGTTIKSNIFQVCDSSCVYVRGDNIVVSLNKINHSEDGEAIDITGNGATVSSNIILLSDSGGVSISGNTATVTYNRITDVDGDGIYVSGSGATVKYNTVTNANGDGIYAYAVTGPGATVSNNSITNANGYGVYNYGASPVASFNRVTYSTDTGVYVTGRDTTLAIYTPATATYNVLSRVLDGLYVYGTTVTVDRNNVRDSYAYNNYAAIEAGCTTCSPSSVSYNVVTNTGEDCAGVYAYSSAAGLVVQYNIVNHAMDYAFYVDGPAVTVKYNRAADQGGDSYEACFYLYGAGLTVSYNTASRCSEVGFEVDTTASTYTYNTTNYNYGNGWDIYNSTNTFTNNRSQFNIGAGFAVTGGTSNVVGPGNVGGFNRTDFCDDGTTTTQTGNLFATTAPNCDVNK